MYITENFIDSGVDNKHSLNQVNPGTAPDDALLGVTFVKVIMVVLQLVITLCDFIMQIVTGVTSPFLVPLSYYTESRVLEVVGIGFLKQILMIFDWIATGGFIIQSV